MRRAMMVKTDEKKMRKDLTVLGFAAMTAVGLSLPAAWPGKARAACADHDGPFAAEQELGAKFAEAAAQTKTAGRELKAARESCPEAPAAAPAAKRGVFFRENPDFTPDWDFTASHRGALYPGSGSYPDGSPRQVFFQGYHKVKVGERTIGIGYDAGPSEDYIDLYPSGALKTASFPGMVRVIRVGGAQYAFLSYFRTDRNGDGDYVLEFHENGELKSGFVAVPQAGCSVRVFRVTFDAAGKLVEAVDAEDIPGFGKPSLYPDFWKDYEEALRENRQGDAARLNRK